MVNGLNSAKGVKQGIQLACVRLHKKAPNDMVEN